MFYQNHTESYVRCTQTHVCHMKDPIGLTTSDPSLNLGFSSIPALRIHQFKGLSPVFTVSSFVPRSALADRKGFQNASGKGPTPQKGVLPKSTLARARRSTRNGVFAVAKLHLGNPLSTQPEDVPERVGPTFGPSTSVWFRVWWFKPFLPTLNTRRTQDFQMCQQEASHLEGCLEDMTQRCKKSPRKGRPLQILTILSP